MSTIKAYKQILIVGAGTDTAQAIFEITTNESPAKRMLVARTSKADPEAYFLEHDDIDALGIFTDSVRDMFEDAWPADLSVQLGTGGNMPSSWTSKFAQADFGTGKVGTIEMSNFLLASGGYTGATKIVAANTSTEIEEEEDVSFLKRESTKFYGIVLAVTGFLVAGLLYLGSKK